MSLVLGDALACPCATPHAVPLTSLCHLSQISPGTCAKTVGKSALLPEQVFPSPEGKPWHPPPSLRRAENLKPPSLPMFLTQIYFERLFFLVWWVLPFSFIFFFLFFFSFSFSFLFLYRANPVSQDSRLFPSSAPSQPGLPGRRSRFFSDGDGAADLCRQRGVRLGKQLQHHSIIAENTSYN